MNQTNQSVSGTTIGHDDSRGGVFRVVGGKPIGGEAVPQGNKNEVLPVLAACCLRMLYESRLFFTDGLIGMGARIILCDPHRAVVIGPDRLRGTRLSSPDIRAGMALLLAALCAEGESVIQNVIQIDRGFWRIDERLRQLGAQLEREQ